MKGGVFFNRTAYKIVTTPRWDLATHAGVTNSAVFQRLLLPEVFLVVTSIKLLWQQRCVDKTKEMMESFDSLPG